MLKPQQHSDFVMSNFPPVFGKPWFWQRNSSSMEGTRSLAQVIMEMRNEIKKLEAENRELRGDHGHRSLGITPEEPGASEQEETVENPYVNLRRNASAPVLERQYKDNMVMTVRRYSTSANLENAKSSNSGWGRLQEEIQHGNEISAKPEVEKVTNRHSLQECVHKNRAKVKTVTFLLPVDDIYTSRPVLTKHLEEPKLTGLASIADADS
ncbi:uncharacterized protein ACNS7B_015744 [Menidia menidia]